MKGSWKLAGALILLLVLVPVLGALGWAQVEFVFAGNLSAVEIHPTLSLEVVGFWNTDHLWLHALQIFQVVGGVLLASTFSWMFAECDKFRHGEHLPTITVDEKRVLRR